MWRIGYWHPVSGTDSGGMSTMEDDSTFPREAVSVQRPIKPELLLGIASSTGRAEREALSGLMSMNKVLWQRSNSFTFIYTFNQYHRGSTGLRTPASLTPCGAGSSTGSMV